MFFHGMLVASRSTCIGAIGKCPALLVMGLSLFYLFYWQCCNCIPAYLPERLIFSCRYLPFIDRSNCSTQGTRLAWLELGYPPAIELRGATGGSWSQSTFNPYICLMVLGPYYFLPSLLYYYMPDMLLYFIISKVLLSASSPLI